MNRLFLIQHGWGRRQAGQDLLDETLARSWAQGVILAPGDQVPESLQADAATVVEHHGELMIDPQLYVLSIPDHDSKRLDRYEWFPRGGTLARLSPREVIRIVESALDFQRRMGASALIAPTPILRDLGGSGEAMFHLFASCATDLGADVPLYLTLVVPEYLLADWEQTRRLLDLVTAYDVFGFYFIVSHTRYDHPLRWDGGTLARAGMIVSQLASEQNEYQVIVGYAGLTGFFLRCVGAEAFASGWSNAFQRFHESRWQPGGFGAPPLSRFASPKAFGNLLVHTHVAPLLEVDDPTFDPADVVGGTMGDGLRALFPARMGEWTTGQFKLSHFETCNALDGFVELGSLTDRLQNLIACAQVGIDQFASAKRVAPIRWEYETGPSHLQIWQAAAAELAEELRVSL